MDQYVESDVVEVPIYKTFDLVDSGFEVGRLVRHLSLSEDERKGAHFGIEVADNSMSGDDILLGDTALIRQQAGAINGDIAVIVINTPEINPFAVLKQYDAVIDVPKKLKHWLFRSSNPSSNHLLVMPRGADVEAIKNLYIEMSKETKTYNQLRFFTNAEITIAGVCVGVVKEPDKPYGARSVLEPASKHLLVQIPLPVRLTIDDYFLNVADTLKAIEAVYSIFALVYSGKSEVIASFVKSLKNLRGSTAISNHMLNQFLAEAGVEPLQVDYAHYGSDGSFDILGLGKVLEVLRDTIKDLVWRGKHERLIAEQELENKRLEAEKKILEIAAQKLELIKGVQGLYLSETDRRSISSLLVDKMGVIANAPVAPQVQDGGISASMMLESRD